MTHTMHRLSAPDNDFVLHVRPARQEPKGTGKVLGGLLKRLLELHPVNAGSPSVGTLLSLSPDALVCAWTDGAPLHVVFDREEKLAAGLRILREADTGFSVSVSVPMETADRLIMESGCPPAGWQLELIPAEEGILPERSAGQGWLECMLSLCGHMRIAPAHARHLRTKILQGTISPEDAALELGRSCPCGCFNIVEAARLFRLSLQDENQPI